MTASPTGEGSVLVGVISDTHGLLRDQAVEALRGVERIIHAGDVDVAWILDRLEEEAPVSAVRGNVDRGAWADALPESRVVEVGGRQLYVIHDPGRLDLDPRAAGFDAVIHGHTHRPREEVVAGVLHLNPGSAGPARAGRPVTLARLHVGAGRLDVEIVEIS